MLEAVKKGIKYGVVGTVALATISIAARLVQDILDPGDDDEDEDEIDVDREDIDWAGFDGPDDDDLDDNEAEEEEAEPNQVMTCALSQNEDGSLRIDMYAPSGVGIRFVTHEDETDPTDKNV